MTEISLQIWYNNSSEAFLSNPLATCLQKFPGGVQKQRLTLSFPCASAACWVPSPPQVKAAHTGSCGACSGALSKGMPAWQSIRVWRTPWQAKSAACCKAATLEWLCPPSLLPQQESVAALPCNSSTTAACSGQRDLFPPYSLRRFQSPNRQPEGWVTPWHVCTEPPAATRTQCDGSRLCTQVR